MPDLLIRRARLVSTLAAGDLAATDAPVDVSIVDGVIADVGYQLTRRPGVTEVNADGRWVMPGLWDKHAHLGQWTAATRRLDFGGTRSPEQVLALVSARLRQAPGQPILGAGMRAGLWHTAASVRALDVVSGDVPVALVNADLHHAWCNTAALDALELPRREGVVAEAEWFAAYPRLDAIAGSATGPSAYRSVLQDAAARGIVGIVDLEFESRWEDWATRWEQGCDVVRIRWGVYPDGLDGVVAAGLTTGDPLHGRHSQGPNLVMGPLKIISDGSLGTRTAWCCDPYDGEPDNFGARNLDDVELATLLERATAAGLQVATHAIGDRALTQALDCYAATGARGSIEHAQLVTKDAVAELARLGLTASVQPAHLLDDREISERVWPDRTSRCFALGWMRDAGVDIAFGSDAPVAALDPWLAIYAAVHRIDDEVAPWHPEQALTVAEAIAYSVDRRVVGVGAPGDVVLLDADPIQAEPAQLRSMSTALTVVGGRIVHDAS
ncbi:MAG: amidohydrolase family protein [Mycobacterium sp.]